MVTATLRNSAATSNTSVQAIIAEAAQENPIFKSAISRRTGGTESTALLSTNVGAWTRPSDFGREVAVILADPVSTANGSAYIAIRFDGQIVQFAHLRR
jgi:hypothetical protein